MSGNPLGYPTADDGMAALAGVRTLANLRTLALRNNEQPDVDSLHAHGVEQLARSTNFPHLKRLDLAGHRMGVAGLRAVLGGPLSERLTELDLSNNDLGGGGERWAADLADLAGRRRPLLRRLALGGRRNRVSRQTVADLLAWVGRGDVRTLDLTRAVLTPAVHAAVLRSPAAGRVRTDPPPLGGRHARRAVPHPCAGRPAGAPDG